MRAEPQRLPPARVLLVALGGLLIALALPAPWGGLGVGCLAALWGLRRSHAASALWRPLRLSMLIGAAALLVSWAVAPRAAPSWMAALALASRVFGATAIAGCLSRELSPTDLLRGLHALRVPLPLLELLCLSQRGISVLRESAQTAREAQLMRLCYGGFFRSARATGELAGLCVLRATDRAQRTAEAIAMRGGSLALFSAEGP